jgi:citrate lyase subunit beta/citryl-CoA lyase
VSSVAASDAASDADAAADADARAAVHDRLRIAVDFQADLDIEADEAGDGRELLFFRSQIVLASRLAGLQPPVDGVSTAIEPELLIEADARAARALGFGAKLCIHPKQVAAVHRGFSPTPERIAWARRVVAADAESGGAPVQVDGKMVDRPVVLKAQAVLRAASR